MQQVLKGCIETFPFKEKNVAAFILGRKGKAILPVHAPENAVRKQTCPDPQAEMSLFFFRLAI